MKNLRFAEQRISVGIAGVQSQSFTVMADSVVEASFGKAGRPKADLSVGFSWTPSPNC
ncbi:MAG TPA: hypothetical protein VH351_15170 [Bryobacteraceae bacterium]|nr:hypothetical protein [Bryobacteraceae bacterium]